MIINSDHLTSKKSTDKVNYPIEMKINQQNVNLKNNITYYDNQSLKASVLKHSFMQTLPKLFKESKEKKT